MNPKEQAKQLMDYFDEELKKFNAEYEKYKKEHPTKVDDPDNRAYEDDTSMEILAMIPAEEIILFGKA